ncbi:hypothetical protein ACO22_07995 [Paracoccidioides brasiliensis]|uniref:Uncharacterized protein n=1 Tax=Paracoccidioides brasiliensis TaxID=121759 RepID=A0A1D2J3H9_PARBR|nr:hypothetical protein ACO22_07995 [Paracoccidioides brasiliensis]
MSHSGHSAPSGGGSSDGGPSFFYMQEMYWAVVGMAVGIATVANILNKVVAVQRRVMRSSFSLSATPGSIQCAN